jgi:hypothetical protein
MIPRRRYAYLAGILGCVLLVGPIAGCGNGGDGHEAVAKGPEGYVQSCLSKAGARFVKSPEELTFLRTAAADDEVSRPGLAYDRQANVVVRVLVDSGQRPPRWMLWYAQPFSKSASPEVIIRDNAPNSYVAYVFEPTVGLRHRVASCVEFGGGSQDGHTYRLPPGALKQSD